MHLPGSYHLEGLLVGRNIVIMAGPFVIKRVGKPDPRRKYYSETAGRRILGQMGVLTVPIHLGIRPLRAFVMQKAVVPTLNRALTVESLEAFGDHVIGLAGLRLPLDAPAGFYWLDEPRRLHAYPSYADFLLNECLDDRAAFAASYPSFELRAIDSILRTAQAAPERLLVPTDIAPKNVVYYDGDFAHLDLEVTLVGAPEFLLVKAAVNLASDVGNRFDGRRIRARLLEHCSNIENARAALVFALVRRMAYEARAQSSDQRASHALRSVLVGEPLKAAITCLEGSWDVAAPEAPQLVPE